MKSMTYDETIYADFETTVTGRSDQTSTEVWSAALLSNLQPCIPESVRVVTSIDAFMNILDALDHNTKVYFHNLKFDGSFILTYLIKSHTWTEAEHNCKQFEKHQFTYSIAEKGMWYQIQLFNGIGYYVTIWDSLKLAPMSLRSLGKAFKTPHQKLEMEYKGEHHAGGYIDPKTELPYIQNDVLVLREVMETLNAQGVDAMTIGSACMSEFYKGYTYSERKELFPDLSKESMPDIDKGEDRFNHNRTYDSFIRRSYHGGFCYVNPKYQGQILHGTISHVDANSHYPSMMHSDSGNVYPVGEPTYVNGEEVFNEYARLPIETCYYFVRFLASFKLKPRHIPSIQIKSDPRFIKKRNQWLTSSDNYIVDFVMTRTDYERFRSSYEVSDFMFIEAVAFQTVSGIFDDYINHWYSIKQTATGAQRQIAKLFLNNLYGKFASSRDSSFKVAHYNRGKGLTYTCEHEEEKRAGYIPIGSAITSYARNRTIELAEIYYDYYLYSDTDSNAYLLPESALTSIPIHPSKLCYWKVESESDTALYVRQKTYYEHVTHVDSKPVQPYDNLKCCGMSDSAKNKFLAGIHDGTYTLSDFRQGLEITGNLKSKNVDGGILLLDTTFKMR